MMILMMFSTLLLGVGCPPWPSEESHLALLLLHLQTLLGSGHATAACEDDGDLPITPERMIRWRSVNSSQNRHDESYLHMTKDDGYS